MGKNIGAMFVIDEKYQIVYVNEAAKEYNENFAEGKLCYEVFGGSRIVCSHCPLVDLQRENHIFYCSNKKEWISTEMAKIDWPNHGSCYAVYFQKMMQENTSALSKLTEESQKEAGELLFESDNTGIIACACAEKFPLYFANNKMVEMLGYDSQEEMYADLKGSLAGIIHPNDYMQIKHDVGPFYYAGLEFESTFRMKNRSRQWFWVIIKGRIVEEKDGMLVMISLCNDITDALHMKDKLEEKNVFLLEQNEILSYMNDGMPGGYHRCSIEPGYPLVYVSDKFLQMFGYTKDEIASLFDNKFINMVHPDDRKAVDVYKQNIKDDLLHDNVSMQYRMKAKEGYIWVVAAIKVTEYRGEKIFQGVLLDVSAEKALQDKVEQLRQAEKEKQNIYEMLVSSFSDNITDITRLNMITEDAVYLSMAEGSVMEQPFDMPWDKAYEMLGTLLHPDDKENFCKYTMMEALRKMREGDVRIVRYRIHYDVSKRERLLETDYKHYMTKYRRSVIDGTPYVLATTIDETEFVEEANNNKRLIENALEEAQKANIAKSIFLNNMSHDIRTPMNAILGFTALATSNINNSKRVKDYLGKITMSGRHLLNLINDVLDMSRVESGKLSIDTTVCDLENVIRDVQDMIESQAEAKQISFMVRIDVQDEFVFCDTLKMNQVLINLLSNAVKYTQEKGEVLLTLTQIERCHNDYGTYEFRVRDNGYGMSEEFLKVVFQPFERERTQKTCSVQGTGLGLSITKNIIDMMGGEISVSSELDKGSEFVVKLKLKIVENSEREAKKALTDRMKKEDKLNSYLLIGKKMLFAEDNDINAEITLEILNEAGIVANRAINGKEAVEMYNASALEEYDAILMDIQMPIMDGYEATRTIRALDRKDAMQVPIIALSANAFDEDIRKSLQNGMDAHLSKPIMIDNLMATLGHIIREKNALSEQDSMLMEELVDFEAQHITNGMPGGLFIYEAYGDEKIIYANPMALSIWGCDNLEELRELSGNSFKGMVHPRDIARVENSIEEQIRNSDSKDDYVEYRIIRKDGGIRWVEDYGHLSHHDSHGDVFYVFVTDSTEKHTIQSSREVYESINKMKEFFDIVRLVNPAKTRQYTVDEYSDLEENINSCFCIWGKNQRCDNCISAKAYCTKGQMTKFEFLDGEIYHVAAKYYEIDHMPYVLELSVCVTNDFKMKLIDKDAFIEYVKEQNRALYIDAATGIHNQRYYNEQIKMLGPVEGVALFAVKEDAFCKEYGNNAVDMMYVIIVKLIRIHFLDRDDLIRYHDGSILLLARDISYHIFERKIRDVKEHAQKITFDEYPGMKIRIAVGISFNEVTLEKAERQAEEALKEALGKMQ